MAIQQEYRVRCDGCGGLSEPALTLRQAWQIAVLGGWVRTRIKATDPPQARKHYCWPCFVALPQPRPELEEPVCSVTYGLLVRERKNRGGCDTVDGKHGETDLRGVCPYCGRRVCPPASRPEGFPVSVLTVAYDRAYNPDWGGRRGDIDV